MKTKKAETLTREDLEKLYEKLRTLKTPEFFEFTIMPDGDNLINGERVSELKKRWKKVFGKFDI
jgi:hypothetical protein